MRLPALESHEQRKDGRDRFLVGDSAQAGDAVEAQIEAYDRFAVIAAESGDPIDVLAKPLSGLPDFSVQVCRRLGNPV